MSKTHLNTDKSTNKQDEHKRLADLLINNPETRMRIGIKEAEEIVRTENKKRKVYAPLSTEEKALLDY